MLTEVKQHLGPATITEIVGDRIQVRLHETEAWAQIALAVPYKPVKGDVVLVIGEEDYYVIGVLFGRGKTSFQVPGELELEADRVSIIGHKGIRLQSRNIQVHADQVETVAGKILNRCTSAYQWVKERLHIRAHDVQTNVEGRHLVQADKLVHQGKNGVRINGSQINLV